MNSSEATAALLATLAGLWPGARVELTRARHPDPGAAAEFLVLPHSRAPRLLLPAGSGPASASVRRFSAAATRREVLARTAAASALRLGGTRALGERVRVYTDPVAQGESLAEELARVLGHSRVTFSLGIGPARVNRKPVLQVFGDHGRSVGFAKLGDTDTARADVSAEADALARLAEHRFRTLRVPRVLHAGSWQGVVVLVQEDLAVSPRALLRGRRTTRAAAATAMEELGHAFGRPARHPAELDWWARCRDGAGGTPDRSTAQRFVRAQERLAEQAVPVPVGAWHGDWTPWNMAPGWTAEGRSGVLVWDWERFETDVPRGLDRVHHAVNAASLRHGTGTEAVRTALLRAGADPVPGGPSHTVAGCYLAAVTARYLAMSAAPAGDLVAPRARSALEALERWTGLRR